MGKRKRLALSEARRGGENEVEAAAESERLIPVWRKYLRDLRSKDRRYLIKVAKNANRAQLK